MINIGIIGYGMSAKTFHEPFIRAHKAFNLTSVVSSKSMNELPADITAFPTLDAMLDSTGKDIDVVINTAPTAHHFSLSAQVLKAKKHLVLEKPMTTTVAEAENLIQLATDNGVELAVYHNRRFTGDFQTVKQLIAENRLGEVRHAEIHFDRFRPIIRDRWRENAGAGSGMLYDIGSHLIDQALQLFGQPKAVTARSLALRPNSPSVDYFHIQLHYANLEVALHSSPYNSAPNPMFRVEGDKGCFIKYGLDPQEAQLQSGLSPLDSTFANEDEALYGTFYNAHGESEKVATLHSTYLQFYDNLARVLTQQSALDVQPSEALAVIKIIELAQRSSDSRQTLIV